MKLYGLIGNPLTHSFSARYFNEKFEREKIPDCRYDLFPLQNENELPGLISNQPDLLGLNVTIPFKQKATRFLDEADEYISGCGSVNCIKIERNAGKYRLKGFNTDVPAFKKSLESLLNTKHKNAIILGTGGAANSVALVLIQLNVDFVFVSRKPAGIRQKGYHDLDQNLVRKSTLIINTTPVGTFPYIDQCPDIPYKYLTPGHLLFDLVYNPDESLFLKKGRKMGTVIKNGLEMLHLQAEKSWEIWNKYTET
ncbi:MAG: shikimate dehydrogenase [Bacteroidetes bacterium]|nr:shikimate dehydrogenase [Bacteroidota bacterium]